jgi:HEAT repeat protein
MGILSFAGALSLVILLAIPAFADEVDDLIIDLTDHNYTIRADAALALGNLREPRALEPLIEALNDSSSFVRADVARALFVLKDARSVDPLIRALNDEDPEVRAGAASALGWIKDRRATDPLIQALDDDDDDAVVRSIAAASLVVINDTKALEPLIRALNDDNSNVRANAAIGLGQLKSPDAVNPLIQVLSDKDSEVRWRAAYSLGEIRDNLAMDPLKQALDDEDATVREEAATALEKLGRQQGGTQGQRSYPAKSNGSAATNDAGENGSINTSQFNIETSSSVAKSNAAVQKIAGYLEAGDIEGFNSSLSMKAHMMMSEPLNIPVDRAAKVGQAMKDAKVTSASMDIVFYETVIDGTDYSFDMAKEGREWKLDQF